MQDSRQEERARANELMSSFLDSPAEDDRLLSQLISEHASPMIREIVRFKFQSNPVLLRDTEDVHNDIVVALLDKLRQIRQTRDTSIHSFRDYVAVASYNRCHQHFRQKFPRRRSTENRVRYFLTHTPGFSLWQNELDWVCGTARWSGRADPCSLETLTRVISERGRANLDRNSLQSLFQAVGAPIRLEDLVDSFADSSHEKEDSIEPRAETSAEPAPFFRAYLEKAWKEILELPQKQRAALLLSLRDEQGDGMLIAFVAVGIAGISRIAEALQMKLEDLARLWNDLPLSDLHIADLMGIKRQQVINLRKCARERLDRRLVYSKKR